VPPQSAGPPTPGSTPVLADTLVMLLPLRRGAILALLSAAAIGVTITVAADTVFP